MKADELTRAVQEYFSTRPMPGDEPDRVDADALRKLLLFIAARPVIPDELAKPVRQILLEQTAWASENLPVRVSERLEEQLDALCADLPKDMSPEACERVLSAIHEAMRPERKSQGSRIGEFFMRTALADTRDFFNDTSSRGRLRWVAAARGDAEFALSADLATRRLTVWLRSSSGRRFDEPFRLRGGDLAQEVGLSFNEIRPSRWSLDISLDTLVLSKAGGFQLERYHGLELESESVLLDFKAFLAADAEK